MYQALYRKWRPRTFDAVVGQEHITSILKKQIMDDKPSHAYLFVGTRGTGKTSCAKILSRAVNCEKPENGNPCNSCKSCAGIEDGSILDVEELDAASNNGVDNVRALRDEAIFMPVSVKKRVYIIDEVHMLTREAFNALLKILEEPPEHLIFILATTELNKVPATILSRCQRHLFKRLGERVITARLNEVSRCEGIALDESAAEMLSRLADGSMRDALSLLDQCAGNGAIDTERVLLTIGRSGSASTVELFEMITGADASSALVRLDEIWRGGKSPVTVLEELSGLVRDILISITAPRTGGGLLSGAYSSDVLRRLSATIRSNELLRLLSELQSCQNNMRDIQNQKTAAEICLIKLCAPEADSGIGALEARVAKLERMQGGESLRESYARAGELGEPSITTRDSGGSCQPEVLEREEESKPENEEGFPPDNGEDDVKRNLSPDEIPAVIRRALEGKLDVGSLNIIRDTIHTDISFENGTIYIKAKNDFALHYLNRPDVIKAVKEAAVDSMGDAPSVKITGADEQKTGQGKLGLDSLLGFGNVIQK